MSTRKQSKSINGVRITEITTARQRRERELATYQRIVSEVERLRRQSDRSIYTLDLPGLHIECSNLEQYERYCRHLNVDAHGRSTKVVRPRKERPTTVRERLEENQELVIAMLQDGATYRQIDERLGLNTEPIVIGEYYNQVIKPLGVVDAYERTMNKFSAHPHRDIIIQQRHAGKSFNAIGRLVGLRGESIRDYYQRFCD